MSVSTSLKPSKDASSNIDSYRPFEFLSQRHIGMRNWWNPVRVVTLPSARSSFLSLWTLREWPRVQYRQLPYQHKNDTRREKSIVYLSIFDKLDPVFWLDLGPGHASNLRPLPFKVNRCGNYFGNVLDRGVRTKAPRHLRSCLRGLPSTSKPMQLMNRYSAVDMRIDDIVHEDSSLEETKLKDRLFRVEFS